MERNTVLGFLAGAATMYLLTNAGQGTGSPYGTYSRYGTQGTGFGIRGTGGVPQFLAAVGGVPTLSRYRNVGRR